MTVQYDPLDDGVNHINIYTKSRTRLGRLASNLSTVTLEHPDYGWFASMEGFWFWLSTGQQYDELKVMKPHAARRLGKTLDRVQMDPKEFQYEICKALVAKVCNSQALRQLLRDSGDLPLVHYYFYGKYEKFKVIVPPGHDWQMEFWEYMRTHLQNRRPVNELYTLLDETKRATVYGRLQL